MTHKQRYSKGRSWFAGTVALAGMLAGVSQVHASQISFSASAVNVTAGQSFTLDILGSFGADYIYGESLDLTFSTGRLQVTSVTVDAGWDFTPNSGAASAAGWNGIQFAKDSQPYATGNFTIATVTFSALTAGTATDIGFANVSLAGCAPDDHQTASFEACLEETFTPPTLLSTSVTVNAVTPAAVPLPAAVWLLGSGLMGLVTTGRIRRTRHHGA